MGRGKSRKLLIELGEMTSEAFEKVYTTSKVRDQHGIEVQRVLQRTQVELENQQKNIQAWVAQRLSELEQPQENNN